MQSISFVYSLAMPWSDWIPSHFLYGKTDAECLKNKWIVHERILYAFAHILSNLDIFEYCSQLFHSYLNFHRFLWLTQKKTSKIEKSVKIICVLLSLSATKLLIYDPPVLVVKYSHNIININLLMLHCGLTMDRKKTS